MTGRPLPVAAWWGLCWASLWAQGCEPPTAPSSFIPSRPAATAPAPSGEPGPSDEPIIREPGGPSSTTDPTLGGRCADDAQCDDGIDCTFDTCDPELDRCRFVPDDMSCQDGRYCNGVEVCSPARGCRPGDVVTCDDRTACTIDRCIEAEQSCAHEPRDADGDGDLDAHCSDDGKDCDDRSPFVSGLFDEVCGNGIDDDCDQEVDELECESPEYDKCSNALEVSKSESFALSLTSAQAQTSASCSFEGARDLFVDVVVEEGPKDVLLTVLGGVGSVALASFAACGSAPTELDCAASGESSDVFPTARLLLRSLPEGRHSVAVFADTATGLELQVDFANPTDEPGAETCGEARSLVPGEPMLVDLYGAVPDEPSDCLSGAGDRVFRFDVDEPSDVHVFASATDGLTQPMLSLRAPGCGDELRCVRGEPSELFARGVAPGEYSLVVASENAGRLSLLLELDPETEAPAGDVCDAPPVIANGDVSQVHLDGFTDDVSLGCLAGARDAVFRLSLDEPSDVLLLVHLSANDTGAVGLAPAGACDEQRALGCVTGDKPPLRLVEHRLLPGDYDVVVESELGAPLELVSFVRPAVAPIVATSAEDCETFIDVPFGGGSFQGNSSSAIADFSASCDVGGISEFGAADHLLRLRLEERRRVFLDMAGSAFSTVLSLREGPDCPGREIDCASTFQGPRSFLDVILEPGEYFVQVDGYAGLEGQWFLEAFEAPP